MKITAQNRIFITSEQKKIPLIIYLSRETITVNYKMHKFYLPKVKFLNLNSQMGLNFNRFSLNSQRGKNAAIFILFVFANFFFEF